MLGGALFHRLAQIYYRHLIETNQPNDIEVINPIIQNNIKTEPLAVIEEYTQIFRAWAERQSILEGTWDDILLEKRLAVDDEFHPVLIDSDDDWDSGSIFVRGVLDRLDIINGITIRDYKTDHIIPSQEELSNSLQTKIYPILAWEYLRETTTIPKPETVRFVYEYVRFGVTREIEINMDQLYKYTPTWLINKAIAIEGTTEYQPTFCSHCESCPVRDTCPAIQKALSAEIKPAANPEEAIGLAESLIAYEQKIKDLKELLDLYIENHGSVRLTDREYRQKVSESYEFTDAKKLTEYLIGLGVEKDLIWQMLKAGKTDFERMMKKLKRAEEISAIVNEVGTPKFETRKQFYKVKE
jgi:RecB family exonuclease